jgi:hypothetical protein
LPGEDFIHLGTLRFRSHGPAIDLWPPILFISSHPPPLRQPEPRIQLAVLAGGDVIITFHPATFAGWCSSKRGRSGAVPPTYTPTVYRALSSCPETTRYFRRKTEFSFCFAWKAQYSPLPAGWHR